MPFNPASPPHSYEASPYNYFILNYVTTVTIMYQRLLTKNLSECCSIYERAFNLETKTFNIIRIYLTI
jgi:hypothetical protein